MQDDKENIEFIKNTGIIVHVHVQHDFQQSIGTGNRCKEGSTVHLLAFVALHFTSSIMKLFMVNETKLI